MLVDVALPLPLPRTFTYRSTAPLAVGTRVRVPFSGRKLIGWVIDEAKHTRELKRIRDVDRVLDATPSVPADVLALCRWIAEYYVTPLGMVLRGALPAVLSDTARNQPPDKTRRVLRITRELPTLTMRAETFGRAARQRECYEVLESIGGHADVAHLTDTLGFSAAVLRALVDKGVAQIAHERTERDPFADVDAGVPTRHPHTPAQQAALAALVQAARARSTEQPPFLLYGVTGSGKTLVYIELLREVVMRQGRGAIVLVPEIALTPQTVARFRAEFGDIVAVLHSALSDGERYDAWRALHDGQRRIAIGARSAIFAPVRDLGAIIVDEEHEASYKQSEAPRYHAREVAIVRATAARAVCVLGSATPSLESWYNAQRGKYRLLRLPERVEGRPLPPVEIIDLRRERAADEAAPIPRNRPLVLTELLIDAIHERLQRAEQCILLLNRRGYATFVQCRACGNVWHCEQCNVSLTYHRGRKRLVCHYCMAEQQPPVRCDECHSEDIAFRGVGTEQVEREVAELFPHARVARMDVDTTSAKWSHHEILERVGQGTVDILLGTQMIAKGLDFPNVTLVGVVNADVAMNLPDFRASERTFQLLTQVAGRAGRGPRGGRVLIQTALPQHYTIKCAIAHDYEAFAERELTERAEPQYPPHARLANIVVSGTDEHLVQETVQHAADWVLDLLAQHRAADAVTLTGPAPCPIDRIRGRWRWHFLLRSTAAAALGAACRLLQTRYELKPGRAELRMIIDRDPVSLL